MRELFPRIFKIFSAQVIAALCMGSILLLTATRLGVYNRGIIATLDAFCTLTSRVASMSLGLIVISENQGGIDREQLAQYFSMVLSYSVMAIVVLLTISAGLYRFNFYHLFSEISVLDFVVGVSIIPFLLWEEYTSNFLTSLNRVETYNRNMVEARILGLLVLFVLIKNDYLTITSTLIVLCVIRIYSVMAGWRVIRQELQHKLTFKLTGVLRLFRDGVKLHLMPLGILLLSNADILMVKGFCGIKTTGQYQFAAQIKTMIILAVHAAAIVFLSKLSETPAREIWQRYRTTIYGFIACIIGLAIVAALIIPKLIVTWIGNQFAPSASMFVWLLIPMVLESISILLTHQWIGRKLYWQASITTLIVGALHIVLAVILLPSYGVFGVIIAATVAYVLSTVANIAMIHFSNLSYDRLRMKLSEEQV